MYVLRASLQQSSAICSPPTACAAWRHTTRNTAGAAQAPPPAATVALTRAVCGRGSWDHSSPPISKCRVPPLRDASKRRNGSPASAGTSATPGWAMSQRSSTATLPTNRVAVSLMPEALLNFCARPPLLVRSGRAPSNDLGGLLLDLNRCILSLYYSVQTFMRSSAAFGTVRVRHGTTGSLTRAGV